jgi:NADH-quinone oxidoreductase subunit F
MLTRIIEGGGQPDDLERLDTVAANMEGRTICALGDAAAMPVRSFLKHFRHEFEHYIEHGRSIVDGAGAKAA